MDFFSGIYNLSLGVGLTREAQATASQWVNATGPTATPDLLSNLLGWGYAFADILVIAFIAWRFSSFLFKKWPIATIALPALITIIWALIFNPLTEAERASIGFAEFGAYIAGNPITISGWIAFLIAGITIALFFYPWKNLMLSAIFYVGWTFIMGSILAWQIMDPQTLDWAVTLSLVLINFSFIFKILRLPLLAIGRAARKESSQVTSFYASFYALLYTVAFVWLNLMYPNLYLGPVHASFLLLLAAIGFAALSMLTSGRPRGAAA